MQSRKFLILAAFSGSERQSGADTARASQYASTLGRRPEAKLEFKGGIAFIEIGKCRVYEHALDVEWLSHLEMEAPKVEDEEGLLRLCLPDQAEKDPTLEFHTTNAGNFKAVTLTSSRRWRIRGREDGFVKPDPDDPGGLVIGFRLHSGQKDVTVAEYHGKYVLISGYHRACALYKAGHRKIPVQIKRSDDKESVAMVQRGLVTPEIVLSDAAPILEDYFTPAAIMVEKRRSRTVITISALQQKLPVDGSDH